VIGWLLLIVGGALVVTPGMFDPFAPVNGMTILGLVLVVTGTLKLVRVKA